MYRRFSYLFLTTFLHTSLEVSCFGDDLIEVDLEDFNVSHLKALQPFELAYILGRRLSVFFFFLCRLNLRREAS